MAFNYNDYYELNYLESSGTQYINTGIKTPMTFSIRFELITTSNNQGIFGQRVNSVSGRFGSYIANQKLRFFVGNSYIWNVDVDTNLHQVMCDLTDPSDPQFRDNAVSYTYPSGASVNSQDFWLFGCNGLSDKASQKLYWFRAYDGAGEETAIFKPAERKSDGVLGLYEEISETFYENDGTGDFISGGRVGTQYVVSVGISPTGAGSVSGAGTYEEGDTATLTATANAGFVFSLWSDGSNDNPHSFEVEENVSLYAYFVSDDTNIGLPSGYTALLGFPSRDDNVQFYIDTGIYPTEQTEIELNAIGVYEAVGNGYPVGYVFGCRNTNSNTSQGQFGLYIGYNGNSYFCFNNQRVANVVADNIFLTDFNFYNKKNTGILNYSNIGHYEFTATNQNAFTSTQPIHLCGFNNGGTHIDPELWDNAIFIRSCRIKQNGNIIRDFVPAYHEAQQKFGLFDMITREFYEGGNISQFHYLDPYIVQTADDGNGTGYVYVDDLGYVNKARFFNRGARDYWQTPVYLHAEAREGYVFDRWEDGNGNVLSRDADFTFAVDDLPKADITATAYFVKKAEMDFSTGFNAIVLAYGNPYKSSASFLKVRSAEINEDALQRTTSTIELENVPSSVIPNCVIYVFDPKNRLYYTGIVKEIDGNTITCREPVSIFDDDIKLLPSMYDAKKSLTKNVYDIFNDASYTDYLWLKRHPVLFGIDGISSNRARLVLNPNGNVSWSMPQITEPEVVNGEDFLIDLFNQFGIYYYGTPTSNSSLTMRLVPVNNLAYPRITISDNIEVIKDVSITESPEEYTYLLVYTENGATLRGQFAVNVNGDIDEDVGDPWIVYDANFKAYNNCRTKVVLSSDVLQTIAKQELNPAVNNHKITFTLDNTGMMRFENMRIGQPVSFYVGSKVYDSVITAWSYTIEPNADEIKSVSITLGNVRTNMTSKLNMKKKR